MISSTDAMGVTRAFSHDATGVLASDEPEEGRFAVKACRADRRMLLARGLAPVSSGRLAAQRGRSCSA
jgi:hypothetical protein